MSLLSKLASSTYIIAEANIWLPVLPSTPGHLLGVFEALGYRFQLLACFVLVMISLLAGFHVCEYACHLGMYLQRLHRKWWKLLRTQWLSAVILMQMRHKCCVGQGNVTSSCYVNFSSNLTSLQFIQISEPDKCHLASFISFCQSFFHLSLQLARCCCVFDSCFSVSFFLSLFCSEHWPYFCQLKFLIALSSFLFRTHFSISVGRSQSSQRSQVIFTWPDQSTLLACLSFSPHTCLVFWLLLIVSFLWVGKQHIL